MDLLDVTKYLVCTKCRNDVHWFSDKGECTACGAIYNIKNDIVDMRSEKQSEPELYKNKSYKKLAKVLNNVQENHYREGSASEKLERKFKNSLISLIDGQTDLVVDIGCGTGSSFRALEKFKCIIGVEFDMRLLEKARKDFPKARLVCCDISQSPFRSGVFSTVTSMASLEHIFWLDSTLSNLEKMLKPDGKLYAMVPNEGGLAWSTARYLFTMRTNAKMSDLLPSEFIEAVKISHCNTIYSLDSALHKFFTFEKIKYWPFNFGGVNVNLVTSYRLAKLNF